MKCRAQASRMRGAAPAWILSFVFVAALGVPAAFSAGSNGPLESARRQFDAGQYEQAAAMLRAAIEKYPQDAALYHWLARCHFELRNYDQAIAHAKRSVALDPQNSEYHLLLGRAYGRKAEQAGWFSGFSLARKTRHEFEEAVRLDPRNFPAQRDLIEFYLRAPGIVGGGEDKARQQIEALAAVDAVEGHMARGVYWVDRKKPDQAEEEYRQVLAAKPRRVDPYLAAADFYVKRSDASHLEEVIEAAKRMDPSDRRLGYYCGVVRVLAGNHLDEAEQYLKAYLATVPLRSDFPPHADAHEWLGRLYEHEGKCQAAAEEYREALELDPRSKSAREAARRVRHCPSGP